MFTSVNTADARSLRMRNTQKKNPYENTAKKYQNKSVTDNRNHKAQRQHRDTKNKETIVYKKLKIYQKHRGVHKDKLVAKLKRLPWSLVVGPKCWA